MLDGVGKDELYSFRPELFQHRLNRRLRIQSVIRIVGADGVFNGLFTVKVCLIRAVILCHLPMLGRIGGRMEIERDGPLFFQNLTHIIRSVFNAVPDHIHVAGLQLLKVTVHIGQRCRRIQKRLGLGIGQLQVLHRHHNVLPDGVLIGMVQDFLRGLAFQPVPVFVLFSGHLLIKGRIQIVGIHVIAPPHVVSVSFQGYGVAPGASSCPAPKAVRSWQPQFPAGHGPCRQCSAACPVPPDGRT